MKTFVSNGKALELFFCEIAKSVKLDELVSIDGTVYRRVRRAVGNGWEYSPFMRVQNKEASDGQRQ